MARTLWLIKHARPEKLEGVDSHTWPLSAEGREATVRLAGKLSSLLPASANLSLIATSEEPKAAQTAQILAEHFKLPCMTFAALGEHDRTGVALMKTPEFVSAIANFFHRPNQLVLGNETAKQALKRFEKAIDDVLASQPEGDVLVVSHGTVLALWLECYARLDGYTVWRQMGLPSVVAITWPDCDIVHRLDSV